MSFHIFSHYLFIILITLQIILINSTQPADIISHILTKISNFNSATNTDQQKIKLLSNDASMRETDNDGIYSIQISFIGNQSYTDDKGLNYPQVKVSDDCKNKMLAKYTNTTNIVVSKLFKKIEQEEDTVNEKAGITHLTEVLYYQFFPYVNKLIGTNNPFDISTLCGEKVLIYSPLYLDETLKKKFVAVAGQNPDSDIEKLKNYDIFYPNAKIYTDICHPITFSGALVEVVNEDSFKNYDITLEQRKKYYFPGDMQLCSESCEYMGSDKDTVSTICQCDFKSFTYNTITVNEAITYAGFSYNQDKFKKSSKDNYFSMETFKCIQLPFTKSGFKGVTISHKLSPTRAISNLSIESKILFLAKPIKTYK